MPLPTTSPHFPTQYDFYLGQCQGCHQARKQVQRMTSYSWSQMFTYGELYTPSISVKIVIRSGYHHVYDYRLWSQATLARMCHALFSLNLSFLIYIMVVNYTCLTGIFGLLNAIVYLQHLAQCPAHNTCLINVAIIIIDYNSYQY